LLKEKEGEGGGGFSGFNIFSELERRPEKEEKATASRDRKKDGVTFRKNATLLGGSGVRRIREKKKEGTIKSIGREICLHRTGRAGEIDVIWGKGPGGPPSILPWKKRKISGGCVRGEDGLIVAGHGGKQM